jgi:hypothetical protein
MSHFNLKTLSFYGIAIGSVLILFKTVSAYGESKLKAPPNINGNYQFLPTENLPSCLQERQLTLNIEQSGIYLFGDLTVASKELSEVQNKSESKNTVKIPFSGNFQDDQVVMSGKGNVSSCDSEMQLTIQGKHDGENLVGQIKDDSTRTSQASEVPSDDVSFKTEGAFVAKFQKAKLPSAESGH